MYARLIQFACPRHPRRPRRLTHPSTIAPLAFFLLLALPLGLGCEGEGQTDWNWNLFGEQDTDALSDADEPVDGDSSSETLAPPPPDEDAQRVTLLNVRFAVLRARAPAGLATGDDAIWNHLDEEVLSARKRALLNRNGLRAARGIPASWTPIRTVLKHNDEIALSDTDMSVSNGQPLSIEIDPRPRDQVLFMMRPDGTGAGQSFPNSMNYLRVEYRVPADDPEAVTLRVMPELRMPRDPETIELTPETWHLPRSETLVHVLRDLAFDVKIRPDEFLVIGPSAWALDNPHLPGALILCEEIDGRSMESLYFITPSVDQASRMLRP